MNRAKNSLFHRFLGLRRNTTSNSMGGIEFISPGLISGWVYSKKINFYLFSLTNRYLLMFRFILRSFD